MSADKLQELHVPAGSAASGPYALRVDPEQAGWGFSGLRVLELEPGGSHARHRGQRVDRAAAQRWLHGVHTRRVLRTAGQRERLRRSERLRLCAARCPCPDRLRCGRPLRPGRSEVRATTPRSLRPRAGGTGRTARLRHVLAAGQQLRRRRHVRVRQADRRRGAHARRELVLLPAAQARRAPARSRVRAGGDLLLRDRAGRCRLPPRLAVPARRRRRPRRGAHRGRRPHPGRLARPVHRRARAAHVLPQCDGGAGRGPRMADPRPPRPQLDPRDLAHAAGRFPAAAVRDGDRRGGRRRSGSRNRTRSSRTRDRTRNRTRRGRNRDRRRNPTRGRGGHR